MTLYDLRRERAEYELELAEIEARRGSYCNVPTEAEKAREAFQEYARKADTEVWKKCILPGINRRAMYATMDY